MDSGTNDNFPSPYDFSSCLEVPKQKAFEILLLALAGTVEAIGRMKIPSKIEPDDFWADVSERIEHYSYGATPELNKEIESIKKDIRGARQSIKEARNYLDTPL